MIDVLTQLPGWIAVGAVCVIVAAEPALLVGVVLPSVASMVFLGFLTGLDVVPLWAAVLAAGGAALAGDAWAFRSGRRSTARPSAEGRLGRVVSRGCDKATDLFVRVGVMTVALARWITVARTIVPRLAGGSGLSWPRFLAIAAPSAWLWSSALIGAGNLVGASYAHVGRHVGRGGGAVLVLALAVASVVSIGHWIGRHPDVLRGVADDLARTRLGRVMEHYAAGVHAGRRAHRLASIALLTALLVGVALFLYPVSYAAVRFGGLTASDAWLVDQLSAAPGAATSAAAVLTSVLRSTYVLAALAALGISLECVRRRRGCPRDLADRLAALGLAVFPLTSLAAVGVVVGPFEPAADPAVRDWILSTQLPVVTAAVLFVTALLTERRAWPVRAAAATAAVLVALGLAASRVQLGWDLPSTALTSMIVGVAWALLMLAAWHQVASRAQDIDRRPHAVADAR